MKGPKIQFEHPTQIAASTFLRAVSDDDAAAMWEKLSRETRGLLEGLYAARAAVALQHAAGVESTVEDARLAEVVAPLRLSVIAALGGADLLGGYGVSGARLVDRATAYVLLLPDFGDERIVTETDWKPSHLLAFVHESREWLIDLGRTAELSAEAELPNPLGVTR
ncbi:MAG TPA: hypothetical protein VFA31_02175 [Candidatus Polarisedimenticolia bacterium]|jgi:hypothetical protein|nr:hypothetical protein [Candidatus Polarisedimenticolia bacterium]